MTLSLELIVTFYLYVFPKQLSHTVLTFFFFFLQLHALWWLFNLVWSKFQLKKISFTKNQNIEGIILMEEFRQLPVRQKTNFYGIFYQLLSDMHC